LVMPPEKVDTMPSPREVPTPMPTLPALINPLLVMPPAKLERLPREPPS
jgi:hypothetical protein